MIEVHVCHSCACRGADREKALHVAALLHNGLASNRG